MKLFQTLQPLLENGITLQMRLTAAEGGKIHVDLLPIAKGKDQSLAPARLTGTPAQLDEGYLEAIGQIVANNTSLQQQIEANSIAARELAKADTNRAVKKAAPGTKTTPAAPRALSEDDGAEEEGTERATPPAEGAPPAPEVDHRQVSLL